MSGSLLAAGVPKLMTPQVDWTALEPALILIGGAVVLLVLSALIPKRTTFGWQATFTIAVASASIVAVVPLWHDVQRHGGYSVASGAVGVDGFSLFLSVVIAASVILAALLLDGYLKREGLEGPEGYVLLLLSASGGLIMASADDLVVMFLGLEVLSIAVYVLAGLHRKRRRSGEAALKYFVLGSFSSAFFLYGIAFVYGATGSTNLIRINAFLATNLLTSNGLLLTGFALLLVGLGFKVAAVPFHSWVPDVYQGSPSPVVSYMASGVKAAGFAGLLRAFYLTFGSYGVDWQPLIYGLAVATLFVGAILAVVQRDVKRMLAYSSINHAGFILVGVQAATQKGVSAALFYLATYTFLVAGSFGVVTLAGRKGDGHQDIDDYKGLARRQPLLAFAFTIFLLAQAGVPLTAGFMAKFYVIAAAVDAHSYWLGIAAMVSAVISAFLYLRIVATMYTSGEEPADAETKPRPHIRLPAAATIALVIAFAVTIGVGFFPGPLSNLSRDAVPRLVATSP